MIHRILGVLDIITGVLILLNPSFPFIGILIYIYLIKGIWSMISSAALGFYLDWMGWTDVLAGIALFAISRGWSFVLFPLIGIGLVFKGVYSLV